MFATLGPIVFEAITSPDELRASRPYTYVDHDVVEAQPKTQWIANDLETITMKLRWHVMYTNPQAQMNALRDAADAHQALPLVFGNGIHRGLYTIRSIDETIEHTADDGSLISIEVSVTMKEYAPSSSDLAPSVPDPPAIDPVAQPGASVFSTIPSGKAAAQNFEVEEPAVAAREPVPVPAPTPGPFATPTPSYDIGAIPTPTPTPTVIP